MISEEQEIYLYNERQKEINGAACDYDDKTMGTGNLFDFVEGAEWADKNPSVENLLKVFWEFDEHGLIKDDLCFDPEHFMRTVIKEHWNNKK